MTEEVGSQPEQRFARAAIEWAGGARGHVLVDAAAEALAEGLDSPSLRVLAGAPRAAADEEATELGPQVFEELGLRIEPRLSAAAIIAAARLVAADLVAGHLTPRAATTTLYRMYVESDYPGVLADFSGYDDWYDMLRDGVVAGLVAEIDEAVMRSARSLALAEPGVPFDLSRPFLANDPSSED